jgi:hypothetical protein
MQVNWNIIMFCELTNENKINSFQLIEEAHNKL